MFDPRSYRAPRAPVEACRRRRWLTIAATVALPVIPLQRFSPALTVRVTAPLGVIGAAAALLASGRPFGFVAMLGTIAPGGMIVRNAVIRVDQARPYRDEGHGAWEAVRESVARRFRPILLTAAAAILATVPLSRDVLRGPRAFAIMGGLTDGRRWLARRAPGARRAGGGVRLQYRPGAREAPARTIRGRGGIGRRTRFRSWRRRVWEFESPRPHQVARARTGPKPGRPGQPSRHARLPFPIASRRNPDTTRTPWPLNSKRPARSSVD